MKLTENMTTIQLVNVYLALLRTSTLTTTINLANCNRLRLSAQLTNKQ